MTEKIIDRVRKLLSLAQSANVHEAAAAAAAAQRLMAEHAIAEAMLVGDAGDATPLESVGESHLAQAGERKLVRWLARLATVIAAANDCRVFLRRGVDLRIIGTAANAATVGYLYSYLRGEIDRLCEAALATRTDTWTAGKTWAANFRLGAVEAVGERLKEARAQARTDARQQANAGDTLGNGAALARVNHALARLDEQRAEVDRVYEGLHLRAGKAWSTRHNAEAREAGRRAGAQINLSSGRPLASGSRANLQA